MENFFEIDSYFKKRGAFIFEKLQLKFGNGRGSNFWQNLEANN